MQDHIDELIQFLKASKGHILQETLRVVLGLSDNPEFHDMLGESKLRTVARLLLEIGGNEGTSEVCGDLALSSIVNITSSDSLDLFYLAGSVFEILQEKHFLGPAIIEYRLLMILTNITRKSYIDQELLIWRLFGYYSDPIKPIPGITDDTSEMIGDILINLTHFKPGRIEVMRLDPSFWRILSNQTKNHKRRLKILKLVSNLANDNELIKSESMGFKYILILLACLVYPDKPAAAVYNQQRISPDISITQFSFGLVDDIQTRELCIGSLTAILSHPVGRYDSRYIHYSFQSIRARSQPVRGFAGMAHNRDKCRYFVRLILSKINFSERPSKI